MNSLDHKKAERKHTVTESLCRGVTESMFDESDNVVDECG